MSCSLALQPDSKILAVGSAKNGTNYDFGLTRRNPDGSPDNSFDSDGKLITDFGATDGASAVALQPDNKIVVAGYSSGRFAVARYNADGSPDASFGTDGTVTTAFVNGEARDLAIQPDGKIVVAGIEAGPDNNHNENFVVVRYNADGSLDGGEGDSTPGDSFDGDGKLTTDLFGGSSEQALGLALGPDGKIVLAGNSFPAEGDNSDFDNADFALARYNPDGSLDASFDSDGKLRTDFSSASRASDEEAWDVAIQPDGKVVVAGQAGLPGVPFATARYNSDGSLDASFGTGGKGDLSVSGSRPALAIQADGKLVLAGGSGGFHLVRYYGGDDATAPAAVTDLTATTQANNVTLSWTNLSDPDFEVTRILRSTTGYAENISQTAGQTRIFEGTASSYIDAGLVEGTRYYYTAFTRDTNGNWGMSATASAVAEPETTDQMVAAGGTLTSDDENDGATASDPVETTITSPVEGQVSVTESAIITEQPAGYSLLGQQANIEALPVNSG